MRTRKTVKQAAVNRPLYIEDEDNGDVIEQVDNTHPALGEEYSMFNP